MDFFVSQIKAVLYPFQQLIVPGSFNGNIGKMQEYGSDRPAAGGPPFEFARADSVSGDQYYGGNRRGRHLSGYSIVLPILTSKVGFLRV